MLQVSVITPSFRPSNFDRLHEAMAANADVEAEWIVVDDGSGSDFDSIFASLPERVRLIRNKENRRQGAARNTGLSVAKGSWVKFLDADDMLDKGHLSALLAATGRDKVIPFAPTKHVYAGGGSSVNDSWRGLADESHAQFCRQLVRPFLHHCGALFPRELLIRLGGYDESLRTDEDGDLLLRILREGYYFSPVEGVYYHYIHHQDGARVSADDDIRKMQARIQVCDKIEQAFSGHMPQDVAQALAQRLDKVAMAYWPEFPSEARELLARADKLSPGYQPDMRLPFRLLRKLCGPAAVFITQRIYRQLKGQPKGGAQG